MKCAVCQIEGVHHVHFGLPTCRECRVAQLEGLVRPFLLEEHPELTHEEAKRRIKAAMERERKTNKALDTVLRVVEAMKRAENCHEKGAKIDEYV